MSLDAGLGMLYGIVTIAAARLLGYRIYLQHHSYAYLSERSHIMATLVRVAGPATHLCSCADMAEELNTKYVGVVRTLIVPVSYAIEPNNVVATGSRHSDADGNMRVGHYGNLSMAKGLRRAVETLDALILEGIPAKLVLAGPAAGPEEAEFIRAVVAAKPHQIEYVGAIYGPAREELLRSLDVLLFPSAYNHESFGLAFWEALGQGIPAVAYRAGCLTQRAAGRGATVLEPSEPFVPNAVRVVRELQDCEELARRRVSAARSTSKLIEVGLQAVDDLVAELGSVLGTSADPARRHPS